MKMQRQNFLTITCCHTNPIGKFIVVPNKNTRCVNSMGNTKHSPGSQSSASLFVETSQEKFYSPDAPL